MSPVRLVVSGCCGRMGSLIVEEAAKEKNLSLLSVVGGLERAGHPQLGQGLPVVGSARIVANLDDLRHVGNLVVEFTTPIATLDHAESAARFGLPMLIGTTGFTPEQFDRLQLLSRQIPIFWSPNMSKGIVEVRQTIQFLSRLQSKLRPDETIPVSILEAHHRNKLDKPSGTAKLLAQEVFQAKGWRIRDEEIETRREGDVIGIHAVTFQCPYEKITFIHEATDRRVFAQGALFVARNFHRLFTRPGWYTMDDFVRTISGENK